MILINLLPVRAVKKAERGRQLMVLAVLVLALAAVGNYFGYNKFQNDLETINTQIKRTRDEIAQLEKTIGEVKSVKSDLKALKDKLDILDQLKRGRSGPVKVMDELAMIIPTKVWLMDFTEGGGDVVLRGEAVAYEDLSAFSKKLKASKHFRDIVIRKASQKPSGTVDWEIACKADYSS